MQPSAMATLTATGWMSRSEEYQMWANMAYTFPSTCPKRNMATLNPYWDRLTYNH